jgi:hypothetical protein
VKKIHGSLVVFAFGQLDGRGSIRRRGAKRQIGAGDANQTGE